MLVTFIRTLILYVVIVFGVRLMGKRQLGELQPSELVVTILISNIATLPIEEAETPLFSGLLPILSLVTFEVIISAVNLRCRWLRRVFSGSPVVVIRNGEIDQKRLAELRFSVDDLMAQLRSNQIFAVDEVDFAVVETTGKLSVYQKYAARTLTPKTMEMPDQPEQNAPGGGERRLCLRRFPFPLRQGHGLAGRDRRFPADCHSGDLSANGGSGRELPHG